MAASMTRVRRSSRPLSRCDIVSPAVALVMGGIVANWSTEDESTDGDIPCGRRNTGTFDWAHERTTVRPVNGGLLDILGPEAPRWRQMMVRRRFGRDEVILHEGELGDTLHVIDKGRTIVEVTTAAGDVAALSVRGAGDVIGELAIIGEGRRTAKVTALEPTETLTINRARLDELRNSDPRVDRYLVTLLAEKLAEATNQLMEVLFLPVDTRVLRVLVRLADAFDSGNGEVVVRVRQEDIAAMAGTRRQTANRTLKDAEAAGTIQIRRGRIEITDRKGLEKLAG
jgi:CRP/FNR family cyclic AMP-dependent transcriptional regulator